MSADLLKGVLEQYADTSGTPVPRWRLIRDFGKCATSVDSLIA